jgi:hypothetical protein
VNFQSDGFYLFEIILSWYFIPEEEGKDFPQILVQNTIILIDKTISEYSSWVLTQVPYHENILVPLVIL